MTPEEYKELGNKAFSEQNFEGAIQHYTEAIRLDPKNHVFFSNRSASHSGMKDWQKAIDDAKECIRLNPQFMKGYYRLATAQLALEEFDLALATIKQGLSLDANNSQLLKVMKTIKQSKKAATAAPQATDRKLDVATSQELHDLQLQHAESARDYNTVQANLEKTQRQHKMHKITLDELEANPSRGAYFRSTGKIFLRSTRDDTLQHAKASIAEQEKEATDLSQKMQYLQRKLQSQQQNIKELMSSSGD